MDTGSRTAMVVLAALIAGAAVTTRAEPTLRYNYDYVCNQERVVVGHCRHDSDTPDMPPTTPEDDYCQLYYPDRPKTGGIEAMAVVLRGDLIKSLEACGAFGATGATPGGKAEFRREKIDKSSGKVAWLKQRSEIDCNRRISRDLEVFAYREDETLIGAVQPAPEAAIRESTAGANILAFVCHGKEETAVRLATDESTIMFFAIEQ